MCLLHPAWPEAGRQNQERAWPAQHTCWPPCWPPPRPLPPVPAAAPEIAGPKGCAKLKVPCLLVLPAVAAVEGAPKQHAPLPLGAVSVTPLWLPPCSSHSPCLRHLGQKLCSSELLLSGGTLWGPGAVQQLANDLPAGSLCCPCPGCSHCQCPDGYQSCQHLLHGGVPADTAQNGRKQPACEVGNLASLAPCGVQNLESNPAGAFRQAGSPVVLQDKQAPHRQQDSMEDSMEGPLKQHVCRCSQP